MRLLCVVGYESGRFKVGKKCTGDHSYTVTVVGGGVSRLVCDNCTAVMIDLDAAKDGEASVTVPGLFKPARPTIFSVLGAERRAEAQEDGGSGPTSRRHAFRAVKHGH